ncbi:homocysteine S-methyltransferase family protein, partial [Pseudoalteromonas sp. SIMBA_148]
LLRDDFPTARAWIAFSARNATELSDGTPIRDAVRAIADCEQVVAIGVNCTALEHIESLVREIRGETDKDIVIYPNSGEVYDPVTKTWSAACAVSVDADGHGSE